MALTLISTNKIAAAGFATHFEKNMCKIISPAPAHKVIAKIPEINGLYTVIPATCHHANTMGTKLTLNEAHKILRHISQPALHDAVQKGLIKGINLDPTSKPTFCDACTQAKSTRQPFPRESLWGPAQTMSLEGHLYYISFTDDSS
ncbi:hypothetical protein DFJ58DRAFT_637770, partial [Suillus subalutaceus]|uniref:uncharacterized protein n=1 Tax=Suillus subalutaceus TaxID=48586 RepID=UPI001B8797DA